MLFISLSFQIRNFSLAFGAAESVGILCSLVSADAHCSDGHISVQVEETELEPANPDSSETAVKWRLRWGFIGFQLFP